MPVRSSTAKIAESEALLTLCKAFADPLRQDILRLLKHNSFGVLELCHITTTPQSGMSHHLKILTAAGLLTAKREGTSIFYRRGLFPADSPLHRTTTELFATLDQIPLPSDLERRQKTVFLERGKQAAQFFERCSEQLKENQELVASFDHYSGCVTDLIGNEHLPKTSKVLEIGAGESPLLITLANQFASVLAVDNAETMLNKTRQIAEDGGLNNVECVLSDYAALETDRLADLLVCNMVLHHLPAPAEFFKKASTLLAPNGRLMLIDLCSHQQDWTRDICGDLWLGFDPEDLDLWADNAGLKQGQGAFLGLKNGFQIQLRMFHAST